MGGGGGWCHTASHPGYLPDWHVDIQAVFLTKSDLFWMSIERGGRDKPTS